MIVGEGDRRRETRKYTDIVTQSNQSHLTLCHHLPPRTHRPTRLPSSAHSMPRTGVGTGFAPRLDWPLLPPGQSYIGKDTISVICSPSDTATERQCC